jgi:pyruvate dehydrogenase E2 component (dihydrolipoamide acetyltransferase)
MVTATYEDIPHTRMRRSIADRLTQSVRVAPHFFVSGTARVDALLELRTRLNGYGRETVTINDLVVLGAAHAHVLLPAMNVLWMPDAVRQFSGVDVAVAVRTDRGLVPPVLRGVDRMTVSAVAAAARDLVSRARSGRLLEDELEVGRVIHVTLSVDHQPIDGAVAAEWMAAFLTLLEEPLRILA